MSIQDVKSKILSKINSSTGIKENDLATDCEIVFQLHSYEEEIGQRLNLLKLLDELKESGEVERVTYILSDEITRIIYFPKNTTVLTNV